MDWMLYEPNQYHLIIEGLEAYVFTFVFVFFIESFHVLEVFMNSFIDFPFENYNLICI